MNAMPVLIDFAAPIMLEGTADRGLFWVGQVLTDVPEEEKVSENR